MISQENANLGGALAELLDARDLGVRATPSSPVDMMVSAAKTGVMVDNADTSATPYNHASALANESNNQLLQQRFDEFIGLIVPSVTAHISFAKNVVGPVVTSMTAKVAKTMEDAANLAPNFEVVVRDTPEPLLNEALQATVLREATDSALLPEADLKLPQKSLEEVYALMSSGSGAFDESVRAWISKRGDDFFAGIWGSVFSADSGNTPATSRSFAQLVNDPDTGAEAALAIYLLTQRLEDEVPEGVAMDLGDYVRLVRQYRNAAIETLGRFYRDVGDRSQAGTLVQSVDKVKLKIVVHGDVYRRWLETGGTPEVLAGMAVDGSTRYTVQNIDDRKAEFLSTWNSYAALQQTLARTNGFNLFKSALVSAWTTEMLNPFEQEKDKFADVTWLQNVNDLFQEEMKKITVRHMEDVGATCQSLLCSTRFFYTDSGKILDSMVMAAKANPSIDAREAALIAIIEYVSDYIADQLQVV